MEVINECRRIGRDKVCLTEVEKESLKKQFNVDVDTIPNVKKGLLAVTDQILAWKMLNTLCWERNVFSFSSMSGYKNAWTKKYDRQFRDRPNKTSAVTVRHAVFEEILNELKESRVLILEMCQLQQKILGAINLIYHDGCGV